MRMTVLRWASVAITIALAALAGGPQVVGGVGVDRQFGAAPLPMCNGLEKYDKKCPVNGFGSCGPDYKAIKPYLPGAVLDKRFENDDTVCKVGTGCTDEIWSVKDGGKCDPVKK